MVTLCAGRASPDRKNPPDTYGPVGARPCRSLQSRRVAGATERADRAGQAHGAHQDGATRASAASAAMNQLGHPLISAVMPAPPAAARPAPVNAAAPPCRGELRGGGHPAGRAARHPGQLIRSVRADRPDPRGRRQPGRAAAADPRKPGQQRPAAPGRHAAGCGVHASGQHARSSGRNHDRSGGGEPRRRQPAGRDPAGQPSADADGTALRHRAGAHRPPGGGRRHRGAHPGSYGAADRQLAPQAAQQDAGTQPPAIPHRTVPDSGKPGPAMATQTDPVPVGGSAGATQMVAHVPSGSGRPNPAGWRIRMRWTARAALFTASFAAVGATAGLASAGTTSGNHSIGGGNQVNAPVRVPVTCAATRWATPRRPARVAPACTPPLTRARPPPVTTPSWAATRSRCRSPFR
jgi:hypothetical protein